MLNVKIMGERSTGTILAQQLIERFFVLSGTHRTGFARCIATRFTASAMCPGISRGLFGRGNLSTDGYIEKAKAASYETLDAEDQDYVSEHLRGGVLSGFYPN